MVPIMQETLEDIPERRVYVFYENDKPLYVRFAFKKPQAEVDPKNWTGG